MTTTAAQPLDLDALFGAAIESAYPIPDTPHTSVMQRANDSRAAFTKGWNAALIAQDRASQPARIGVAANGDRAITQDWMAYCAILRQAGKEPTDAQGDAFEFAWNAARAAQPERATGTTGARVPTWQERIVARNPNSALSVNWPDDMEAYYMAAEIADLRAQLAAKVQESIDGQLTGAPSAVKQAASASAQHDEFKLPPMTKEWAMARAKDEECVDMIGAGAQPAYPPRVTPEMVGTLNTTLDQLEKTHGRIAALKAKYGLDASAQPDRDAAVAAITYALDREHCFDDHDAMRFLAYWNEGEFDKLRNNWREVPEAVFIGADPLHQAAAPSTASQPIESSAVFLRQSSTFGPWIECKPSHVDAVRFVRADSNAVAPSDATGKADATNADELHFNATRLRNVARLVGLESAVPQDDATLDGARGSVLGMISGKLRTVLATSAADAKDAARYRWLRTIENLRADELISSYWEERLDEAIDAAMAAAPSSAAGKDGGDA